MPAVLRGPVASFPGIAGVVDQQHPASASENPRRLTETKPAPAGRYHVHHGRDRHDIEASVLERQPGRVRVSKHDVKASAADLAACGGEHVRGYVETDDRPS